MSDVDLAAAVTGWYRTNARDLPWRRPGVRPWEILVSEVMLQQTQVARVEPVWREWCARWPEPAALAAEPAGEAIRAWGRLGYPRRALRLHGCATAIVERHGGQVPTDLEQLLALPGIGAYTARAVAAFAHRQRHPVVDTNVRRVFARAVTGLAEAGQATTAADLLTVEAALPELPEAAATASVAFMELGALVCTARAPRCHECPLRGGCAWHAAPASGAAAGVSGSGAGPDGAEGAVRGRRRSQRFVGTDRYVRGLIMAVLRESDGPVPAPRLDAVWSDPEQRARALTGLLADGLVCAVEPDGYGLPY